MQLIQNNNTYHKVLSEVTTELMSDILVIILAMNYSQQGVEKWNCTCSFRLSGIYKNLILPLAKAIKSSTKFFIGFLAFNFH